jgi:hypothetical protein
MGRAMSDTIRIDSKFKDAMNLIRNRMKLDYKIKFGKDIKISDTQVTRIIAAKVFADTYRIPIEKWMIIAELDGHRNRR